MADTFLGRRCLGKTIRVRNSAGSSCARWLGAASTLRRRAAGFGSAGKPAISGGDVSAPRVVLGCVSAAVDRTGGTRSGKRGGRGCGGGATATRDGAHANCVGPCV